MSKIKISLLSICTSELIYIFCLKEALDNLNETSKKTGNIASTNIEGICSNITIDKPTVELYPQIFTLDFGTTDDTKNKITKKGKLKVTLKGSLTKIGSEMEVERIDYSINGMKLGGTIVYTNTTNDHTAPQWTGEIENGKFTDLSGKIYTSTGFHTVKQTKGFATTSSEEAIYEIIEGEYTVMTDAGGKLTLTVQEPLVKKDSSEFISKGKLKIEGGFLNGIRHCPKKCVS
jgi:hypothetical protein